MSTTTTPKPEPRTAAESRREFACTSEPAKRRIAQTARPSDQFTIAGQASLLDCIAADAESTPPAAVIHHAPSMYHDCDAEDQAQQAAADSGIDQEASHEPGAELELDAEYELARMADLPEIPGPFHCRRCARKFAPGELDYFTGLCWACFEKTAVQLHR